MKVTHRKFQNSKDLSFSLESYKEINNNKKRGGDYDLHPFGSQFECPWGADTF